MCVCWLLQVPSRWLSSYCTAACDVMSGMSTQQLTMCLWGLACCNAKPHKAFTLLWFLTSMGAMQRAATQVRSCVLDRECDCGLGATGK